MIIAIDGPAASGKGTLARRIAAHYGLAYLDTGLLYRAVAYAMLSQGGDIGDETVAALVAQTLDPALLDKPELRGNAVGEAASVVAAMPAVRAALVDFQRAFAARKPGAVLDGRDIGTVICPGADVKLFVTASLEQRARRRFAELSGAGQPVSLAGTQSDLAKRDARDQARAVAPMKAAADAHLLDTTILDIEAAFRAAVDVIDASMPA